jgi:hypothetical protein
MVEFSDVSLEGYAEAAVLLWTTDLRRPELEL